MNSLSELNSFVNNFTASYTDQRLANVVFDRAAPANQTQTVDRGFTVPAAVGIEINEVLNPNQSQPIYTIDVRGLISATVTWASLPPGITVTNAVPGVYVLSGITDKASWDLVKSPTIDFADDYFGTWSYTSTIYYNQYTSSGIVPVTKSWTTTVTVVNVLFLSNPIDYIYATSATSTILGVTQIGNVDATYTGATWTMVITPSNISSITNFTTTGTGGTFSVNSTTKVVTITGTRTQVNSRLAGLQIVANANLVDFILTYVVSNSVNAVIDTKSQLLYSQGTAILGRVTQSVVYYQEDTTFTLTGCPVITDIGFNGQGVYFYTITPSNTSAILSVTFGGTQGTATFNSTTKVITFTGTREQINSRLSQISITPGTDFNSSFNLEYYCLTPRQANSLKTQALVLTGVDTEITNMNITRSYYANNGNFIFANDTPYISDFDVSDSTYTISLNCASNQGTWTFIENGVELTAVNPLIVIGNRAYINSIFPKIQFLPNVGVSSNLSFTYTQSKNSVQQVQFSVNLTGIASEFRGVRVIDITYTQNWRPSKADVKYGKIDSVLLVGGGGGGGAGILGPVRLYQGYVNTRLYITNPTNVTLDIGSGLSGVNIAPGTSITGFTSFANAYEITNPQNYSSFNGYIVGDTLYVTDIANGVPTVGWEISGTVPNTDPPQYIAAGTRITSSVGGSNYEFKISPGQNLGSPSSPFPILALNVIVNEIQVYTPAGGGGGGGGEVIYSSTDITLEDKNYYIKVGEGGAAGTSLSINGSNGQETSAFGLVARGGGGAIGMDGGYSWSAGGNQESGGTGAVYSGIRSNGQPWISRLGAGGGGTEGGDNVILIANPGEYIGKNPWAVGNRFNVPSQTRAGHGVRGRYTPEFQVPYGPFASANQTFSYGFGGSGGALALNNDASVSTSGYMRGEANSQVQISYGQGASVNWAGNTSGLAKTYLSISPNRYVNNVRDPSIAGGGGGGGVGANSLNAPPTAGGDGVVRILIGKQV